MRRTRTRMAVAGGVMASVLALAGCGGGDSFGGKEESGDTVRMLVNVTPNLTLTFWRDLVAPFEKETGIKVKIEAPGANGVAATLATQLAAGTEPDVAQGGKGDMMIEELVDLSDEEWATSAPAADLLAVDGKYYAVPVGVQPQSLIFYNKKAFEKAGITAPPKSFDELTAIMQKLKDSGIMPMQTAGDTWVTGNQVRLLAAPAIAIAHPNWFKDVNAGTKKPSDGYEPVVSIYESWVKKGYVPKDALGIKYADGEAAFLQGKTAMYPMGSWFVAAEAKAAKDFEVGVFPVPTLDSATTPPVAAQPGGAYMIFKSSKKEDESKKLVEYLTQDKVAVTTMLKSDGIYRTGYEYTSTPLSDAVQAILVGAPALVMQGEGFGPDHLKTGFDAEFHKQMQSLYIGKTTAEALKNVDAFMAAE